MTRYKGYLLGVLAVILAFNYKDRLAFGLVLQDIKADLSLSDTQLGLLTGIAFTLFYSLMGVPIARWADRGNRVAIIATCTALWSVAVALCGFAGGFVSLLLIRIVVAVGEAGCVPPAHSLIADHFTRAERPRAVSLFYLGAPLSSIIGYLLAGWINELYGWRVTFVALGLPGLGLALLAWFTLKEPRREAAKAAEATATKVTSSPGEPAPTAGQTPTIKEVCVTLASNTTFRHLLIGYSILSFFSSGISQWKPAFFMRSFGLTSGELGTWLALMYGTASLVGTYLGGVLASKYAAANEKLQLTVTASVYLTFCVVSCCTYLSSNVHVALALVGVLALGTYLVSAPFLAIIQTLIPERMRAMSIAIILLSSSLVGSGLGPLAAGALSDAFSDWAGVESLRYALLTLSAGYVWGAWHYWRASKTIRRDLLPEENQTDVTETSAPRPATGSYSTSRNQQAYET